MLRQLESLLCAELSETDISANSTVVSSAKYFHEVDIAKLHSPLNGLCEFALEHPKMVEQFGDEPFEPTKLRNAAVSMFSELSKQEKDCFAKVQNDTGCIPELIRLDLSLYLILKNWTGTYTFADCVNADELDTWLEVDSEIINEYFTVGGDSMFDKLKAFAFR